MANKNIDFNSDIAQYFGTNELETEFQILDYVSSVNVSCGFHAGTPLAIKETMRKCKEKNICIGAHIGFYDKEGFGYNPINLTEDELEASILYQLGALYAFTKTFDLSLEHVRPHGAMYKMAAENYEFSLSIAKSIQKFDKWLTYYGAANENLEKVAQETGIVIAREIIADRPYTAEGLIDFDSEEKISHEATINRVRTILHSSQMKLSNGSFVTINCDTIHFSAKTEADIELAKKSREIITPTPVNYNKVESAGWV